MTTKLSSIEKVSSTSITCSMRSVEYITVDLDIVHFLEKHVKEIRIFEDNSPDLVGGLFLDIYINDVNSDSTRLVLAFSIPYYGENTCNQSVLKQYILDNKELLNSCN